MREVKEIGKFHVVGGAVLVMDTAECADWTTCDHHDQHVHGTMTIAGPNVPQHIFAETGPSHDEVILAMALKAAAVVVNLQSKRRK